MIPVALLLPAYRTGFFPMAVDGQIHWFSPDPRGILPLDRFHASRRLRRTAKRDQFQVTINRAFREVIAACAALEDSWINQEIVESYTELHRLGVAHSIETWQQRRLVGGLYGVALGGAFFGESMFNRVNDASKIALCSLVERLRDRGYQLLDIQWLTPYLQTFGAIEIPRSDYLTLLDGSMRAECRFIE